MKLCVCRSSVVCICYVQEIQLNDIDRVELSPSCVTEVEARHVFEIHTSETRFYVGEICSSEERQSGAEDNGRGVECAQRMAKAIRQAWLPVTAEPADAAVAGLTSSTVYLL